MRELKKIKYIIAVIPILILLVVLAVWWFSKSCDNCGWLKNLTHSVGEAVTPAGKENSESLPNEKKSAQGGQGGSVQSEVNSAVLTEGVIEKMSASEFQNWIEAESKKMNQTNVNESLTEAQLKNVAQRLNANQLEQLSQNILDVNKSANDRIFSTYLLTQTMSVEGLNQLEAVAKSKVSDYGPVTPHSEAEVRNAQDLSMRYMAIDKLAQQAATDQVALEKLKNLITQAENAQVRVYAQRKFSEIR